MIFISLGENCLTDDILHRHGVKSFSTPYSPCRSNIDYALALEFDGYKNFLNKNHLVLDVAGGKQVVRSSYIRECERIYDPLHMKGFEFTHHDVVNNDKHRQSFERKVNRLDQIRFKEDIVFFYHHRRNKDTNLDCLREKIEKFLNFYRGDGNQVFAVLFYQTVNQEECRGVNFLRKNMYFLEFNFMTHAMWGGNNPDLFWGRVDDDLIKEMMNISKEIIA